MGVNPKDQRDPARARRKRVASTRLDVAPKGARIAGQFEPTPVTLTGHERRTVKVAPLEITAKSLGMSEAELGRTVRSAQRLLGIGTDARTNRKSKKRDQQRSAVKALDRAAYVAKATAEIGKRFELADRLALASASEDGASEGDAAKLRQDFGHSKLVLRAIGLDAGMDTASEDDKSFIASFEKELEKRYDTWYNIVSYLIGVRIGESSRSKGPPYPPGQRARELEEFAKRSGGHGVATLIFLLFPEIIQSEAGVIISEHEAFADRNSESLPDRAPALWQEREAKEETPPEFIQRVYGEWMGKGLTLADVRRLDEPLAQSYYYHMRKGRPLPEGFDLPTKPEQNTRWIERVEREGIRTAVTGLEGEEALRAYHRIQSARQRRSRAHRE